MEIMNGRSILIYNTGSTESASISYTNSLLKISGNNIGSGLLISDGKIYLRGVGSTASMIYDNNQVLFNKPIYFSQSITASLGISSSNIYLQRQTLEAPGIPNSYAVLRNGQIEYRDISDILNDIGGITESRYIDIRSANSNIEVGGAGNLENDLTLQITMSSNPVFTTVKTNYITISNINYNYVPYSNTSSGFLNSELRYLQNGNFAFGNTNNSITVGSYSIVSGQNNKISINSQKYNYNLGNGNDIQFGSYNFINGFNNTIQKGSYINIQGDHNTSNINGNYSNIKGTSSIATIPGSKVFCQGNITNSLSYPLFQTQQILINSEFNTNSQVILNNSYITDGVIDFTNDIVNYTHSLSLFADVTILYTGGTPTNSWVVTYQQNFNYNSVDGITDYSNIFGEANNNSQYTASSTGSLLLITGSAGKFHFEYKDLGRVTFEKAYIGVKLDMLQISHNIDIVPK